MRFFISSFVFLSVAFSVFADDGWLTKRALLDREAEALQEAYKIYVAKVVSPAENLIVPIESFPDGTVKASITANKAQIFLNEPYIWCEGVVVREFEEDGKTVRAIVEAESCIIDRDTRSGWAEGNARASYGKTDVSGNGIYFSFAEEFVKIMSNVLVESRDLKFEGVKL